MLLDEYINTVGDFADGLLYLEITGVATFLEELTDFTGDSELVAFSGNMLEILGDPGVSVISPSISNSIIK